jgi:diaminohydroxyphosphoribosylaminopyrimidine deaminase/5-amino-6-(5-phosphoribosylamino)uracil reductase
MVGAVVVQSGQVVGEAWHRKAGTPHAEPLALGLAGEQAKGATLYVTLEPCCHTNKRTPPCTGAITSAGVGRVVIAMLDPNPHVAGKGVSVLEGAGISVTLGVREQEARPLNEAYIKHITTGLPLVILKTAMTLDGRIATPTGQSKWITGEQARKVVHQTRHSVDAIITAVGTVAADDPSLTARVRGGVDPVRVVIDPDFQSPPGSRVFTIPPRTILVTRNTSPGLDALKARGVEVLPYSGTLNMQWLMRELGAMGMTSVLIEGGGSLNAHALTDGIVDRVMFFIAPRIIGGKGSIPCVGGETFRPLEDAFRIEDMTVRRLGPDVLIEGRLTDPT